MQEAARKFTVCHAQGWATRNPGLQLHRWTTMDKMQHPPSHLGFLTADGNDQRVNFMAVEKLK